MTALSQSPAPGRKLAKTDIPADSHFFGKPLAATEMIAEMRNMIGHA